MSEAKFYSDSAGPPGRAASTLSVQKTYAFQMHSEEREAERSVYSACEAEYVR